MRTQSQAHPKKGEVSLGLIQTLTLGTECRLKRRMFVVFTLQEVKEVVGSRAIVVPASQNWKIKRSIRNNDTKALKSVTVYFQIIYILIIHLVFKVLHTTKYLLF